MSSSDQPPPSSKVRITPDPYEAPASRQSTDAFAKAAVVPAAKLAAAPTAKPAPAKEPDTPASLIKAAAIGALVAFVLATITYVVLSLVRAEPL